MRYVFTSQDRTAASALVQGIAAVLVPAGLFLSRSDGGEDTVRRKLAQMDEHIATLPPDRFPHLIALAPAMRRGYREERFEFGLDILVRGLAAHAPTAPGEGSGPDLDRPEGSKG